MKHLTARGRKREVCKLLLKIIQRHAQRQHVQRQQRPLARLAKEPHVSVHRGHPKDNNREQKNRGD